MNAKIYLILGFILVMALIANTVSAWSILPNYSNYLNLTVNSWNGLYPINSMANLQTLNNSFLMLNTLINATLNQSNVAFMVIQGFNANHTFVGNVSAFPSPIGHGILISNHTQFNKPYNSLTIWFNQLTQQSTYLNTFYNNNVKTYGALNPLFNSQYGANLNTIAIFNTSCIQLGGTSHKYKNSSSSLYAGSSQIYFNVKCGYILTAQNNKDNNFTLDFIPYNQGWFSYNYSLLNANNILTEYGFIGNIFVSNQNSTAPYLYLNSPYYINNYNLLSHGIGINNLNPFNNTISKSRILGYFFQYNGTLFSPGYEYSFNLNYTNSQAGTEYFLIPSYSTNYTTSFVKIANPIAPTSNQNNGMDNLQGWYYDYNFRQFINVSAWNYQFQTYAYSNTPNNANFIGNSFNITSGASFLWLNITHYSEMGNNCEYVYFRAYNDTTKIDKGSIPFGIVKCNNQTQTASFILNKTTSLSDTYSTFYVYYGSRSNIGFFNNQGVYNLWRQVYNNGLNRFDEASNSIIINTNSTALNTPDYINPYPMNLSGNGVHDYISFTHFPTPDIYGNLETQFIAQAGNFIYGKFISVLALGSGNYELANTLTAFEQTGRALTGSSDILNFTTNFKGLIITQFYTKNYSVGRIEYFNQSNIFNQSLPHVPKGYSTGSNTFINSSLLFQLNYSLTHANATLLNLGLTKNTNFYGIILPDYYIAIIELVMIFFLILIAHDEIPIILGFIVLWLVGILNIGLGVLGIILILIYMVYHTIEQEKHKDNGGAKNE